jgi:mono/diheme cytochrome c family protein
MPPFALRLSDAELAALLSFVRSSWGNQASALSALEINRYRDIRPP